MDPDILVFMDKWLAAKRIFLNLNNNNVDFIFSVSFIHVIHASYQRFLSFLTEQKNCKNFCWKGSSGEHLMLEQWWGGGGSKSSACDQVAQAGICPFSHGVDSSHASPHLPTTNIRHYVPCLCTVFATFLCGTYR